MSRSRRDSFLALFTPKPRPRTHSKRKAALKLSVESLEARRLLASDFGDAPAPYPTLIADGGAEHQITDGPRLGTLIDADADGTPTSLADGDDLQGSADEDGIVFGMVQVGSLDASVSVQVSGAASKLDAWIDFDGDGSLTGRGEQIFASHPVTVGVNDLRFEVPAIVQPGSRLARFRLSSDGDLGPAGVALDGEVEDHIVLVEPPRAAFGSFGEPIEASSLGRNNTSVRAFDIDQDGDLDIVGERQISSTHELYWLSNDGAGKFTDNVIHVIDNVRDAINAVDAVDLDGDGDLDVVAAEIVTSGTGGNQINWFENDGNENFTLRVAVSNAAAFKMVAVDLDGDSDVDLLTAGGDVRWYENDGEQNFSEKAVSGFANNPIGLTPVDIDSDGDLDVLVPSEGGNRLIWFENDGEESFTFRTIANGVFGARDIATGDFDGDGDLDIVAASFRDNTFAWYENRGITPFRKHVISDEAGGAITVQAADIDGDGDLDVVGGYFGQSPNFSRGGIDWFENDGNGNFKQIVVDELASSLINIEVGDLDSDGDLDILRGVTSDSGVTWNQNDALGGTFQVSVQADETSIQDQFGNDIDISNDYAIVGARLAEDDSNALNHGIAYVYRRTGTRWLEEARLISNDPEFADYLGWSVAIDGDTAVVGAFGKDGNTDREGAAYVFQRDAGGAENWGQIRKLVSPQPDAIDEFGYSVDIDGDTIIVGSWLDDDPTRKGANHGSVSIFQRNLGGQENWGLSSTVFDDQPIGSQNRFGSTVAIQGDTAVVGADRFGADNSGAVFVLERNAGGSNQWGISTRIDNPEPSAGDRFGESIALENGVLVVGNRLDDGDSSGTPQKDSGSVFVFDQDQGGPNRWGQVAKFSPQGSLDPIDSTAHDNFGSSVSISGSQIVVGAPGTNLKFGATGVVYNFQRDAAGQWNQATTFQPSEIQPGERIGRAVAVDGPWTGVGSIDHDSQFPSRALGDGVVYFSLTQTTVPVFSVADPLQVSIAGDINLDGAVTMSDALVLINSLSLQDSAYGESKRDRLFAEDVNGDGHLTPADLLLVLNHLAEEHFAQISTTENSVYLMETPSTDLEELDQLQDEALLALLF